MRPIRFGLSILVAVLAMANWILQERGLGDYWRLAMAVLIVAFVALATWTLSGWKIGRDAGRSFESLRRQGPSE